MARNGLARQIVGDLSFSNSSPFAFLLDQSILSKSIKDARRVHARIIKTQFAYEVFIQNRLIDAYAKCGCLGDARKLFGKMLIKNTFTYNSMLSALGKSGFIDEALWTFLSIPEPDQCSWNLMLSGFSQQGQFPEALEWFVKMHKKGFSLNEYSFGSVISACAGLLDLKVGVQIHGLLSKLPFAIDVYMGSALLDMYAKNGDVECARRTFGEMRERNVVTWNSMITCYEQNGPASEALVVFLRMMESGQKADEMTLASLVSACATLEAIREGRQIHSWVVKFDKYRNDIVLCNALVDMYSKCGKIVEGRRIFDRMPMRNVISETSMVSGYAKAASVEAAKSLFLDMEDRNIVSWNALMAGYTQNGEDEDALSLFCLLKRESVWPTNYTFGNLLNACANLADLNLGKQAHTHVVKHGFGFKSGPESNLFVGNALIDMYMKCGSLEDGSWFFKNMIEKDCVSWNVMIIGYAQNGCGILALETFGKMLECGEKPDQITMIGVLSACGHDGLVDEGRHYFYSMTRLYNVVPLKDHYTCMVDLLGRAGLLQEARDLIETMPMKPDSIIWASLLAACRVHRDIEIGKDAAERLVEMDPTNSGPYVLLSNMYAELGKWEDVNRVRRLMRRRGVIKQPGCSWVEVGNQVHIFMVKDRSHPQTKGIYSVLKWLTLQMKLDGYVPNSGDFDVEYEDLAESDLSEVQYVEAAL